MHKKLIIKFKNTQNKKNYIKTLLNPQKNLKKNASKKKP